MVAWTSRRSRLSTFSCARYARSLALRRVARTTLKPYGVGATYCVSRKRSRRSWLHEPQGGARPRTQERPAMNLNHVGELKPRITIFGVGGAGGNAVNNMINAGLQGVEFVVANTDAQALTMSKAERIVQMGVQVTEG